jgi:DNA transformation protein and related proteins
MSGSVARMRNLGPVMDRRLRDVGIASEDDLRRIGAVEAYTRLRLTSPEPISLIALYAMQAAILGCDWRMLTADEKLGLRRSAGGV